MQSLVGQVGVVPDLMTGSGVHRPETIRQRKVQNSIHQKWRRFDLGTLFGLKCPGQSKVFYIFGSNQAKRTVAYTGIVAMISRPGINRRMQQHLRIRSLRDESNGDEHRRRNPKYNAEQRPVTNHTDIGSLLRKERERPSSQSL